MVESSSSLRTPNAFLKLLLAMAFWPMVTPIYILAIYILTKRNFFYEITTEQYFGIYILSLPSIIITYVFMLNRQKTSTTARSTRWSTAACGAVTALLIPPFGLLAALEHFSTCVSFADWLAALAINAGAVGGVTGFVCAWAMEQIYSPRIAGASTATSQKPIDL